MTENLGINPEAQTPEALRAVVAGMEAIREAVIGIDPTPSDTPHYRFLPGAGRLTWQHDNSVLMTQVTQQRTPDAPQGVEIAVHCGRSNDSEAWVNRSLTVSVPDEEGGHTMHSVDLTQPGQVLNAINPDDLEAYAGFVDYVREEVQTQSPPQN
jgi:hypothetical protein